MFYHEIQIWQVDGEGKPLVLDLKDTVFNHAVLSPDGARLATTTGTDEKLRVWRTDRATEPVVFAGHTNAITSVVFSRDGTRILTASLDGTARFWPTDGVGEPLTLTRLRHPIDSAEFTADERGVVMGRSNETIRVWRDPSLEQNIDTLWRATSYCLSPATRIERLGETQADAYARAAACKAKVAEYAAQGAYR